MPMFLRCVALSSGAAGRFAKLRALPAVLLALVALPLLRPAHAQNVSARVEWYGVYTVSDSKSVEDPRSPTGVRVISTPIPPTSNSDRIPGRDDVRFGLSYVLSGVRGQDVTIRRVFRFPGDGMPNVTTGEKTRTYEDTRTYNIGEPVLMGWSFVGASPAQIPLGEWSLEVWLGNQMVVGRRFRVE
jgi:hypothetical protein